MQYVYGYHYNSNTASRFDYSLDIIHHNLTSETIVADKNYDFYKILEDKNGMVVVDDVSKVQTTEKVAVLRGQIENEAYTNLYQLERIITSPMKDNSDIIYLYTVKGE